MKLASPTPKQTAVAVTVGVATLVLPIFFPVQHHFPWDAVPGFYAMYGAAGSAALVLFAKGLGRVLIAKREGWWGGDDARTGEPP